MDYVIDRANELGLVMGLVTAKSWHVTDHPEKVFDEKNAYVFGKFLGDRYKNNAVIWFPGGDSAPGKYDAVWVAMAKGLKDGSGGSQLVCYHGQGSTSSSMWFHKADWLDFNSIQSGHNFGSDSYAFVSKDYGLRSSISKSQGQFFTTFRREVHVIAMTTTMRGRGSVSSHSITI